MAVTDLLTHLGSRAKTAGCLAHDGVLNHHDAVGAVVAA